MSNMKKQSDYCMDTYIDVQVEHQGVLSRTREYEITIPNLEIGTAITSVSWINQDVIYLVNFKTKNNVTKSYYRISSNNEFTI